MSKIRDYMKVIVDSNEEIYSTFCKVLEVDKKNNKCKVKPIRNIDSNIELNEVQLGSKRDVENDYIIYPKVDSIVLINWITKDNAFIALHGDIDQIVVKPNNGYIFYEGENGGLINIEDLIKKINTIEDDINSLKNGFLKWIVSPTDGGSALKLELADWYVSPITKSKREDIEDDRIKH